MSTKLCDFYTNMSIFEPIISFGCYLTSLRPGAGFVPYVLKHPMRRKGDNIIQKYRPLAFGVLLIILIMNYQENYQNGGVL